MGQLILQLTVGSTLLVATTAVQVLFIAAAVALRPHLTRRFGQPRLRPFVALVSGVALWMVAGQTVGVWIWTGALRALGAFDALEPALYYSLAAYTTLGFGDVLPTREWRILGTMAGANGMLAFGLATAALVQLVGRIRQDLGED